MSRNTPQVTRIKSTRTALSQNYIRIALPALLLIGLATLVYGVWQARLNSSHTMAQEMAYATQLTEEASTDQLVQFLQALPHPGYNRELFAVDADGRVFATALPNPLETKWTTPSDSQSLNIIAAGSYMQSSGNWLTGEIFHRWAIPNGDDALVIRIGGSQILQQALRNMAVPLIGLAILFSMIGGLIETLEQRRARQFSQFAQAARDISAGRYDTRLDEINSAELNELGHAFTDMSRSLKERIDQSSMLLQVSQDVSNTMELDKGFPIILKGLVKATHSIGARAILFNPSGGRPLRYGEGAGAAQMASLDRNLLTKMRQSLEELALRTRENVRIALNVRDGVQIPVDSLMAFPLIAREQMLGMLWIGYDQPMKQRSPDLNLIRSYVTRSAGLSANARLYSLAEKQKQRLESILASTTEAVTVIDHTSRIIVFNPAMELAFGLSYRDVIGRIVRDVIRGDLADILSGNLTEAHGREITSTDARTFLTSVSKVKAKDDSVMGRVAVFHDITRLKQVEEMKSSFVRNVSHDLRNPLTYMHTYAMGLGELGELNENQERYVNYIVSGIERMHNTIGAVLDLNRIESATDDLQVEPIDAENFLHGLAAEFAPHAESQGNSVLIAPFAKPITVWAEQWSLRTILNNLISNALKYAEGSGAIILRAEDNKESVTLSIQDHGPGISKVDQMRLFEKYYRASRPESLRIEGSGLGLAIVKSIAERHGGRVSVKSVLGEGSTFYVSFPSIIVESGDGVDSAENN
ncbi:MAG: ATP-binding protein [Candidatus Promineifilaceae bacterium]